MSILKIAILSYVGWAVLAPILVAVATVVLFMLWVMVMYLINKLKAWGKSQ